MGVQSVVARLHASIHLARHLSLQSGYRRSVRSRFTDTDFERRYNAMTEMGDPRLALDEPGFPAVSPKSLARREERRIQLDDDYCALH